MARRYGSIGPILQQGRQRHDRPQAALRPEKEAAAATADHNVFAASRQRASSYNYYYGYTFGNRGRAVNITQPRFSGRDDHGLYSFVAYSAIPNMSTSYEFNLKFKIDKKPSAFKDNLMMFTGQRGEGLGGDDFLALGVRRGRIIYKFNLGSGVATIISGPLNLSLGVHVVQFGRLHRNGWLKVDDQKNKTGTSRGPLVGLNVFGPLYVGGYGEYIPELLPPGSRFSNGFQGCIFDLQVRSVTSGRFVKPGLPAGHPTEGRSVGQCEDAPCHLIRCHNGGTCVEKGSTVYCQCPFGWKGALCTETASFCDTNHSPPPLCALGATCIELPDGYTCLCPLGTTGKFCQQSFSISDALFNSSRASWMKFSPFGARHETHLQMQFRPLAPDGILFYMAQYLSAHSGDFFCLSLARGHLQLRYNLGDTTVVLQSPKRVDIRGKVWHLVHAGIKGKEGYLLVDDTNVTRSSSTRMAALDTTSELYVGGVSPLSAVSPDAVEDEPTGFTGCIREAILNEQELQLTETGAVAGVNVGDCDGTACGYTVCSNKGSCHLKGIRQFSCACPKPWTGPTCAVPLYCARNLCQNGAPCVQNISTASYTCTCPLGWQGKYCEKRASFSIPKFIGQSYIKYTDPQYATRNLKLTKISLNFTTSENDGLIVWMGTAESADQDYLAVGLHHGNLKVATNLGERISVPLIHTNITLCCNTWHSATVIQDRTLIKVYMDEKVVLFEDVDPYERYVALNYGGVCYIGGFELNRDVTRVTSGLFTQGFVGKIKDVVFFEDATNIQDLQNSEGYNIYEGDS
ncbi:EYS protein, partial [Polypterus senegalus]